MTIANVTFDPQQETILKRMIESGEPPRPLYEYPVPECREWVERLNARWNEDPPAMHDVRMETCPGPHGDIPVRLYFPDDRRPAPTLVFIHGGGWVVCSIDTHDRLCRRLAEESGFAVASVDYRMAPEFRFPCPLDDCVAAVRWIAVNGAQWGLDGTRLALGGDSAGGNLSLATALTLRDAGVDALKALALIYGAFTFHDEYRSSSHKSFGGAEYLLPTEFMLWFRNHYLNNLGEMDDPRASPLLAEHAGLPPCYVNAAALDPLRDDAERLAEKLAAAGVPHAFNEIPGVLHGFMIWTRELDAANTECRRIADFLQQHV